MTLNDRLTRGFLAGVLGGIASVAWGMLSRYILHFTTLLYSDFAGVLILGRKVETTGEKIFFQLVVFLFFGLLGIILAYIVRYTTSKNMLFKGVLWGGVVWFSSYAITLLFKVPDLHTIPFPTAISQLIGGVLWGFFTAVALGYLDRRVYAG